MERRQFVMFLTTAEQQQFTGLKAEMTVDTQKSTAVIHDGITPGGHPLAKEEDLTNTDRTVTSLTNRVNTIEKNKTNVIDSSSSYDQYPSAKAVYDELIKKLDLSLANLPLAGFRAIAQGLTGDPSRKKQISNGFVADRAGWLIVWDGVYADTSIVKVDGHVISQFSSPGANVTYSHTVQYLLMPGQRVELQSISNAEFWPCRSDVGELPS